MLRSMVWWLSLGLALSGLPWWGAAQGLSSGPGASPTHLAEEEVAQGKAGPPNEKYVLSSGRNRLTLENQSDPLVRVELTVHMGSARETVGKSGFSHHFEHVLPLEGIAHAAPGQAVKILSAAGSKAPNGNLNFDQTTCNETRPANRLETGLWLVADQMGFSLNATLSASFARRPPCATSAACAPASLTAGPKKCCWQPLPMRPSVLLAYQQVWLRH